MFRFPVLIVRNKASYLPSGRCSHIAHGLCGKASVSKFVKLQLRTGNVCKTLMSTDLSSQTLPSWDHSK